MKLFTRYSRINVVATIIIFLISSTAFYITLNYVLLQQTDEDLRIEEREIRNYTEKFHKLPAIIPVKDQIIEFHPVPAPLELHHFSTTSFREDQEDHEEKFRILEFGISVNSNHYRVQVSKSLEEMEGMIHSVALISGVTIMAILLVSFFINRVVLKRIWRPFYRSLEAVRRFSLSSDKPLELNNGAVDEFNFMNESLERMTSQAQSEYISLKTFSENASHEIQTPLAIVRSKLDLLIQDENLSETQSQTLQTVYDALQQLTRLNQSLLLLARIENRQFEETTEIDMMQKLQNKIADFRELWLGRQIKVQTKIEASHVRMNEQLADILLNNLLSNATRHNIDGGDLFISLNEKGLIVRNSSISGPLDEQQMFRRFYRPQSSSERTGLGLSIIKQIAEASGFQIRYRYDNATQEFAVTWNGV